MVMFSGLATRPKGATSVGPPPGTMVPWRLAQPIADLGKQAEELNWRILGIVGNTDHLRKHGDHTPWSKGKVQGIIYAIDLAPPAEFEEWLVNKCRSNYHTLWIDFFNINGRQYDNAGNRVASSSDHHLHVSVARGHENTRVTLLTDYARERLDDMPSAEEVAKAVWGAELNSPTLDDNKPHKAHEGVIGAIAGTRRLKAIEERLTALEAAVKGGAGSSGGASADSIADAVLRRLALALSSKGP